MLLRASALGFRYVFDLFKYRLWLGTACPRAHYYITIDPYGRVVPCRRTDKCSFGNVRDHPLHRIWEGRARSVFLERISKAPLPPCRECSKAWLWWGYYRLTARELSLKRRAHSSTS